MDSSTRETANPFLETVKSAVDWLSRQEKELEAKEDELARRMGIDPDKDILIVPTQIIRRYFYVDTRWPRWMRVLDKEQPYIVVGARDRNSFKKGESGK